ncbi:RING/FYVE/PHD zinc finger superfamily protein isoform 4 [Hibiscus syriacus]|uniref:RING/FYVE/PHD zinc finger superfamily protein isoform 4 n=1 Tax=Hibiscus syriacus TaxID=106335 RepID=A0A6A2Z7G2_HIBSY|nr:RING/FYVE/PHD zinc finger superfamily protein isoform 4 [Hibiscus syriacus]
MLIGDVYNDGATRRATLPVKYAFRSNLSDHKSEFQQFKPGYTTPPPLFRIGRIPMNFGENWEISRRGLNNSRFIAVVSTDHGLWDFGYDEYLATTTSTSIGYCTIAIIFTLLLVFRHVLPAILNGSEDYFLLVTSLLVQTVGIILPIYAMVKVMSAIHRRLHRQLQETPNSLVTRSGKENEISIVQAQPHIVSIH